MSGKPDWLARQYTHINGEPREFTEGQVRCLEVLGVTVSGLYNLHIVGRNRRPHFGFNWSNGDRLDVSFMGSMGTFDCSSLTAMVVEAHKRHVRVEVSPRLVMAEIPEIDDPVMVDGCDHEDWGSYCDCTVYPQAVINIGLNARQPKSDESDRYWDYHPGVERLTELAVGDGFAPEGAVLAWVSEETAAKFQQIDGMPMARISAMLSGVQHEDAVGYLISIADEFVRLNPVESEMS